MSLTIILDDTLVAQLQVQAAARNLSVEALALHILSHAVVHEDDPTWQTANQRRIALIRKQFAEGLRADEAAELQQLQDMAITRWNAWMRSGLTMSNSCIVRRNALSTGHPSEEAPMAFTYPRRPHVRRYGPRGYRAYQSYKPWRRDAFEFRCVYCLWRERWCADGNQMLSVDHLWPRMTHLERLCDYDNLVYACCQCNALKQEAPPVLDPCAEALGQQI